MNKVRISSFFSMKRKKKKKEKALLKNLSEKIEGMRKMKVS